MSTATRKPAKKAAPTKLRTVPLNIPATTTTTKTGKPLLSSLSLAGLRQMSPDEIRALIAEDEDFPDTVDMILRGNRRRCDVIGKLLIRLYKPTDAQKDEEALRLDDLRRRYATGEIYDQIQVQIRVLQDRMTLDEVIEQYEEGTMLSAALDAYDWTTGDGLENHSVRPPSADWPGIIKVAKARERAAIRKRATAGLAAAQKAA